MGTAETGRVSLQILFVENDFGNVGGSLRSLHRLASHLDPARYRVHVTFAHGSANPMLADFEQAGFEVVCVGRGLAFRDPAPGLRGWLRLKLRSLRSLLFDDLVRFRDLVRAIRDHRIDLVHINSGLIPWAIFAAGYCRVPVVVHYRGTRRTGTLARFASRYVDTSICNSQFVRTVMESQSRCPRFCVVHNGIAVPRALPERSRPARTVACVGRLVEWKGQHVLIEAIPRVLARVPDAQFVIVGAPVSGEAGAYERRLKERTSELGLDECVTFLGFVKDIDRLYRERFDLVAHTSVEGEPFGLTLIEAMAAGLPIIASRGGACPEIIEDGRSGLLVTPGNSQELADGLARVLSDPALYATLRVEGFERVSERFDMSNVVAGVSAVYDEILAERT